MYVGVCVYVCVVHLSSRDPLYIHVFRINICKYTYIILSIIQFAINICICSIWYVYYIYAFI